MELRFANLARATKDLDLALAGNRNQGLQHLSDACTGPFSAGRARDILDILLMEDLGQLEPQQSLDWILRR
jgi:hypothetical protein